MLLKHSGIEWYKINEGECSIPKTILSIGTKKQKLTNEHNEPLLAWHRRYKNKENADLLVISERWNN